MPNIHSIPQNIKAVVLDHDVASTSNGTAFNTIGARTAEILIVATTASASSLAFKVQESADGSTGWADVTGTSGTIGASQTKYLECIGIQLQYRKQYLRVVYTVTGTVSASAIGQLANNEQSSNGLNTHVILV